MKKFAMATVAALLLTSLVANLEARPQYNKAFESVVKDNGELSKALGGKSNCNLCHTGTKSKKNRNDFGMAVGGALKMKNEMDAVKILKAFGEAAKAKVPGDDSKTFDDLIKDGSLPVTKEEPAQ